VAVSTEKFKLVRLANGSHSLHSFAYGETFHPVIGPVAEAEALYVRQLQLRKRLRTNVGEFVIWDVGLGAAANALTVMRATRHLKVPLRLVSFDNTLEPLEFAQQHAPALGYFAGYESYARAISRGHNCRFVDGAHEVNWELQLGDFPTLLTKPLAAELPKPNAILFDAFSPAKNPAMWTLPLFTNLFRLLDPRRPCALPTYSRSTIMRVTLLLAGFYVGVGHATGEKEETTIAANALDLLTEPLDGRWLQRARRSHSAEPLHDDVYKIGPLTAQSWDALQAHQQFQP